MTRRWWHIITGSLVPGWLLAAVVAAVANSRTDGATWLPVHLLLLGAVSTAILIWSQHFADTLLRRAAPGGRLSLGVRLAAHTVGSLLVVVGLPLQSWAVVLVGGSLVCVNAVGHAALLLAQSRGSLPARFAPLVRYYMVAGLALAVGVTMGILMARPDSAGEAHERLFIIHIAMNVLGWIGLTVMGTVALLWPTILRTRVATTIAGHRATLLALVAGLGIIGLAALVDLPILGAVGVVVYLLPLGAVLREMIGHARSTRIVSFAGWSIGAALIWFAIGTAAFGVDLAIGPNWNAVAERIDGVIPIIAVGFAAQIVIGALSYLIPVVLGGGPRAAKATAAELDRGGFLRALLLNLCLVVFLLPVPDAVRAILAAMAGIIAVSFLVLLTRAMLANARVRSGRDTGPHAETAQSGSPPLTGSAIVAIATILVAVAAGVAIQPIALATDGASSVVATGHTTTIDVRMVGTRFSPNTIRVPRGDTLVIRLYNEDTMIHDLVFEGGATSSRLGPGATGSVNAGLIEADTMGWCSIPGHRQLGMELTVIVTDADSGTDTGPTMSRMESPEPGNLSGVDPMAEPEASFVARDATLPPATSDTIHRVTLTVRNVSQEVAPGVIQERWTYNGEAPGPTLRGQVGDTFIITLVNEGTMGHSIDFHAGALAPDSPMRTIEPGTRLTYTFTATRSGAWLYHCSTMPMSLHIANGMFGAVIIDPPGLAPVDKEFILVQSDAYLGAADGSADPTKVTSQMPDLVVFNGYANQYRSRPLLARVGDRVRVWVVDAGPNVPSSFHVVGGQFDTVFSEGDYLLRAGGSTGTGGSQALSLSPAQGGFVELEFAQVGHYSFISHAMSDAEKGAQGVFDIGE